MCVPAAVRLRNFAFSTPFIYAFVWSWQSEVIISLNTIDRLVFILDTVVYDGIFEHNLDITSTTFFKLKKEWLLWHEFVGKWTMDSWTFKSKN